MVQQGRHVDEPDGRDEYAELSYMWFGDLWLGKARPQRREQLRGVGRGKHLAEEAA